MGRQFSRRAATRKWISISVSDLTTVQPAESTMMCYVTKRLLAHSEPQLQSHKVLTGALIEGCHLETPPGQATSSRGINKKFAVRSYWARGKRALAQVFRSGMQEHKRWGFMRRREQLTTLRGTRTEHQSMQLPNRF